MDILFSLVRLIWEIPVIGKVIAVILVLFLVFAVIMHSRQRMTETERKEEKRIFAGFWKLIWFALPLWFLGFLFVFKDIGIALRGVLASFLLLFPIELLRHLAESLFNPLKKREEGMNTLAFSSIIAWVITCLVMH